MDRRRFVLGTGLLAVGSAFDLPLVGCDSEFGIPCLGPAAAPVPVPGMTYIRASEIGCALDCNLENGRNKSTGAPATDDGPRINAAMAGASANNPITLIIDGSALISGLFLPAGGYWSIAGLGCGTGFFVKSGTNNDGIHNGPPNAAVPFDPGPPAPPRGSNVSLSNFTVNGNQGDGSNGNSTTGQYQGTSATWYCGINLMNLDNITLEKVVVVNTPAYHIRLSNVGNVSASGCVMKSYRINTDGLHFDGPANDITISNCDFTTGDDAIGLNCPEGYSGNISRVTVSDCTFNSYSMMRLYTTSGGPNKYTIDTVNVINCSGIFSQAAFMIGLNGGSKPNAITSLTISDCSMAAPMVLGMAENFGTISLNNVNFVLSPSSVGWAPDQSNHMSGFFRPYPSNSDINFVGSTLSFVNCKIYRNEGIDVAAVILESGMTISNVAFDGFAVENSASYSQVPALFNISSGSIGQLVLDSVLSTSIKSPSSSAGFSDVGSVAGAGLLATGWKFPDSVMANGVPYLSANSGLPSIKVGGVVEPYSHP